jgi:hypothetical protein
MITNKKQKAGLIMNPKKTDDLKKEIDELEKQLKKLEINHRKTMQDFKKRNPVRYWFLVIWWFPTNSIILLKRIIFRFLWVTFYK